MAIPTYSHACVSKISVFVLGQLFTKAYIDRFRTLVLLKVLAELGLA